MSVLELTNPAVKSYIVYSAVLALKTLAVLLLTILVRVTKKVFASPEDVKLLGGRVKVDETVERIRRAHLNDLENIPVFWVLAALYLTTGPAISLAKLLFSVFTICRIIHTLVYVVIPWQPTRAIAFGISYLILWYMGLQVVLYYITGI